MIASTSADTENVFVEQAEYIETEAFDLWSEEHPQERQILQKLCRGGAKLITGPRGCGKTTLLLKAYRKLLQPGAQGIPVYVNFKSSLRLEPLYKNQANAAYWFNQWMLFKCYVGLLDTLEQMNISAPTELSMTRREASRAAENLELGQERETGSSQSTISVDELLEDIDRVLERTGRARCLLFLDDAAHAFSPEQQRDFFDFFRRIKGRRLAPKAAIYPGVTIVSPSFHIGHDAEEIDVWIDPYSNEYLPFMKGLLGRRLPNEVFDAFLRSEDLLDLLCFGSFGVPRALLNIVRDLYVEEDSDAHGAFRSRLTPALVRKVIRGSYEKSIGVFASLRHKLPLYGNFIEAGEQLLEQMILAIKDYNRSKPTYRKSVSVALLSPLSSEIERVFGFLEYAGLVMFDKKVSRGIKGRFSIYRVHAGGLIDRNALLVQRSVSPAKISAALQARNAHEFTRVTPSKLLRIDDARQMLTLALPPCQNCATPRASESAKFCLNCGSPLTAMSTFRLLVQRDISDLPISGKRVRRIKEYSSIRTVGDVLMDHEHRKLRGVPWIGPHWAQQIYSYAEEYIA